MVDTMNRTKEGLMAPLPRQENMELNSPETPILTPDALDNKHNFAQNNPVLNIVNHKRTVDDISITRVGIDDNDVGNRTTNATGNKTMNKNTFGSLGTSEVNNDASVKVATGNLGISLHGIRENVKTKAGKFNNDNAKLDISHDRLNINNN